MTWQHIYFGFEGRINRRTYWLATLPMSVVALGVVALLSHLSTGSAFNADVWQRPADKVAVWLPAWAVYFMFIAWPASAISIKRLHDRGLPAWIWVVYFAASAVLAFLPALGGGSSKEGGLFQLVIFAYLILGFYFFLELGVLQGTRGDNEYGPDTVRSNYYGGAQTFWSWMLAFEGRISRQKWWIGVSIALAAMVVGTVIMSAAIGVIISKYPEFQQNIQNPAWLETAEARPIVMQMTVAGAIPGMLFLFGFWSLTALGVKRLHDRGLSSWLIMVILLPFFFVATAPALTQLLQTSLNLPLIALLLYLASIIWAILQFGVFQGVVGPNEHGPDPLANTD